MSTLTQTSLANIALGHIGKAPIVSFSENSPEALAVQNAWNHARDAMLRLKAWNFACKRVVLSRLADAPAFEWRYQYELPNDYIRVIEWNGRKAGTGEACFDIENGVLLTNDTCANLKYVFRNEQVSSWDDLFCEAFSLELASKVAARISSSPGLSMALHDRAIAMLPTAFGADSLEDRPRAILAHQGSGYLRARQGGVSQWERHQDAHGVWQND